MKRDRIHPEEYKALLTGELRINYKGFQIVSETEPWALKYGNNFRWFFDEEKIHSAKSVEDAKEQIDEEIVMQEYKHMKTKNFMKLPRKLKKKLKSMLLKSLLANGAYWLAKEIRIDQFEVYRHASRMPTQIGNKCVTAHRLIPR